MRSRLIKLLVNAIPSRRIKQRLRLRYWYGDKVFHEWFRHPVMKFRAMQILKDDIEELCIGSSHAFAGYVASGRMFNLGDMACDLYYATNMARYWLEAGCGRLKRIIVFYDVFSPGHNIEASPFAFISIAWSNLYGIPHRGVLRAPNFKGGTTEAARDIFRRRFSGVSADTDYRGNPDGIVFSSVGGDYSYRTKTHLKLNAMHDSETSRIGLLCDIAAEKGVEVVVVIPPLRSDYIKVVGVDESHLYAAIKSLSEKRGVRLLSYHASPEFCDSDFSDPDHLNAFGAAKLTAILHKNLEALRIVRFTEKYVAKSAEKAEGLT